MIVNNAKFESICTHMFMLCLLSQVHLHLQPKSRLLWQRQTPPWHLLRCTTLMPLLLWHSSSRVSRCVCTNPDLTLIHFLPLLLLLSRVSVFNDWFLFHSFSFNRCSRTFSNSQCSLRPPLSLLSITFKHTPKTSPPAWAWSPHNLCCPPSLPSSHSNKKQPLIRWRSILCIYMCQIQIVIFAYSHVHYLPLP